MKSARAGVKVECGAGIGKGRSCKEGIAAAHWTDEGPLFSYQRAVATVKPDKLRAGFIDDRAMGDKAPRLRATEPHEWEPVNDFVFAPGEHPESYDGLWCAEHGLRTLPYVILRDALTKNTRVVTAQAPQR